MSKKFKYMFETMFLMKMILMMYYQMKNLKKTFHQMMTLMMVLKWLIISLSAILAPHDINVELDEEEY